MHPRKQGYPDFYKFLDADSTFNVEMKDPFDIPVHFQNL